MKLDQYDGPRYRYDDPMLLLGLFPLVGFIVVGLGGGLFLLEHRGNRETTPVPSQVRGTLVVTSIAHILYALTVAGAVFL